MALAEYGHPEAPVRWDEADNGPAVRLMEHPSYVTPDACYRAFLVCGVDVPCFTCWSHGIEDTGTPCTHSVNYEGVLRGPA
jgi:hypothetical protein